MIPLTFKSRLEESLLTLCFATCEIALPTFCGRILAIFRLVYGFFWFCLFGFCCCCLFVNSLILNFREDCVSLLGRENIHHN